MSLLALSGNPGKKIYAGPLLGRSGIYSLCFDIFGMDELKEYTATARDSRLWSTAMKVSEGNSFDMGEAAGHFSYIEDPDGILIEFVETHKMPVFEKTRMVYRSAEKEIPTRPLPDMDAENAQILKSEKHLNLIPVNGLARLCQT
ncbi:MAG: hypothetical protein MZU84_02720 [Sphingobacterium sp.]|nr:hypothetical protein [Sphingobacterium sp.]